MALPQGRPRLRAAQREVDGPLDPKPKPPKRRLPKNPRCRGRGRRLATAATTVVDADTPPSDGFGRERCSSAARVAARREYRRSSSPP